ncbi:MAG: NAD-dependent epimerase/dehydratase family protein [Gemmatimonadaceae bacterium]|nr:NAD-dependent epimerase/dehydratase family protein [Gemmatimonadaceae bacterium]
MTRALVTGATGLVGSYIAERLLADGWSVRALVRDAGAAAWLGALGVELARGDLADHDSQRSAMSGCDTVFHCAALIAATGDWSSFQHANIDGTRAIVEAASSAGARLVHTSSVAVYGSAARYRSAPTDEETPLAPLPEHAYYARSKREAEQIVLDAHAMGELWATAIRPPMIYGKRDRQLVPRFARLMQTGFFPLFGGGHSVFSLVHASAVADGAVRAATHDAAGGRAFNLTNDFPVTIADFVQLGANGLDRRVRGVSIPLSAARATFSILGAAAGLAKHEAMAEQLPGTVDTFSRDNPFTSERARSELGWSPTMIPVVGVPEAFRWWKENDR